MDNFLGEIRVFPFGVVPKGWAACNGQTLAISQNQALFSLLGTYYGGNGVSTFSLPNFQCNALVGTGSGNGLNVVIGQTDGSNTASVSVTQLPGHTHTMQVVDTAGTTNIGSGPNYLSQVNIQTVTAPHTYYVANAYASQLTSPVAISPGTITMQGGSAPHENRMPYLAMNVCIALTGYFPTRN